MGFAPFHGVVTKALGTGSTHPTGIDQFSYTDSRDIPVPVHVTAG